MPYNGVTESIGLVPLGLPWSWSLVRKAHDTAPPSSRQPSSISIHCLACAVLSAVRLIGAVIEWPELMLADRSLCSNSPLLCLSHQESVSSVSSTRLTAFQPPLRAPGSLQTPLDHQSNQITAILTACWLEFSGYRLRRFLWLVSSLPQFLLCSAVSFFAHRERLLIVSSWVDLLFHFPCNKKERSCNNIPQISPIFFSVPWLCKERPQFIISNRKIMNQCLAVLVEKIKISYKVILEWTVDCMFYTEPKLTGRAKGIKDAWLHEIHAKWSVKLPLIYFRNES